MSVLDYIQIEIHRRNWYWKASPESVGAMNGLVNQALKHSALNHNREGRLLFLATALQYDELTTSSSLTQGEVCTIIDLLRDQTKAEGGEGYWRINPTEEILSRIKEIERAALKRVGQLELL